GRGSGELDRGQFDRREEVLFPDGAAALYRREMLDVVGLFDETFFAYGDDADLGLRGRLAGLACIYVPTAVHYSIPSGNGRKVLFLEGLPHRTQPDLGSGQIVPNVTAFSFANLYGHEIRVSRLRRGFHGRFLRTIRCGLFAFQPRHGNS